MEWLTSMNKAMVYMEENLTEKIDYQKAARIAGCSVYHFQRLFSYITTVPLSEYIRRRRMTLAAFELQNSAIKVIDLALKYGYESPEAFTRAFQALHGASPSAVRRRSVTIKAYPPMSFQITIKGDSEMNYRIMQKDAFDVYGLEKVFDTKDGLNQKEIPEFWQDARNSGEYEKLMESAGVNAAKENGLSTVNALCDYRQMDGTKFAYMLCALGTKSSNTKGYTLVNVPAATWAVFTTATHSLEKTSSEIQQISGRIYLEWLPGSCYEKVDGYEFEMYYSNPDNTYYEEIWIRVTPKK